MGEKGKFEEQGSEAPLLGVQGRLGEPLAIVQSVSETLARLSK